MPQIRRHKGQGRGKWVGRERRLPPTWRRSVIVLAHQPHRSNVASELNPGAGNLGAPMG